TQWRNTTRRSCRATSASRSCRWRIVSSSTPARSCAARRRPKPTTSAGSPAATTKKKRRHGSRRARPRKLARRYSRGSTTVGDVLFVHETHRVAGKQEHRFEELYREWSAQLAKSDDARLAWFMHQSHGTGPAYVFI